MHLCLSYHRPDGTRGRTVVLQHQILSVGRGRFCDLVIEFDPAIAEEHFVVGLQTDGWFVRCPRAGFADLYVNGHLIGPDPHLLQEGDSIRAGRTQFLVQEMAATSEQPNSRGADAGGVRTDKQPPPPVWRRRAGCQLCIDVDCDRSQMPGLLDHLSGKDRLIAMFNETHFGQPLGGLKVTEDDLFAQAPEEVRDFDSLQLLEVPRGSELAARFPPLLEAMHGDGLSLVITETTVARMREEMRFISGWYARPGTLEFHLTNGPRELTDMLLEPVRCVILGQVSRPDGLTVFGTTKALAILEQQIDDFSSASGGGWSKSNE